MGADYPAVGDIWRYRGRIWECVMTRKLPLGEAVGGLSVGSRYDDGHATLRSGDDEIEVPVPVLIRNGTPIPGGARLTEQERAVVALTVGIARAFGDLEDAEGPSHPSHRDDLASAIHTVQRVIAMRVARRADPDVWAGG